MKLERKLINFQQNNKMEKIYLTWIYINNKKYYIQYGFWYFDNFRIPFFTRKMNKTEINQIYFGRFEKQ